MIKKSTALQQDDTYISGLLQHDKKIIDNIYQAHFNRIQHFIQKNGGSFSDAKDVFQEALIVIYNKAKQEEFQLTSQFFTYLFGTCRFIWFNHRKKKSNQVMTLEGNETYISNVPSIEKDLIQRERYKIYEDSFAKMGKLCQKILRMFFDNKTMLEIAKAIDYQTAHSVRTKKYKCQQQLKQLIKTDKRFKDFNAI